MLVKLEVSEDARNQVRELIKSQKPGTAIRIYLAPSGGEAGGGCCGSSGEGSGCGSGGTAFGMAFDKPRSGDQVVQVDGFSFILDPMSAEMVNGARVDFVQGLDATGFKITPPNQPEPEAPIGSGCGCGSTGGGCC